MAMTPRADIERFELPTRPSLIARVKDLTDAESWSEFYHFYQPLLMRYLRHLGMKEDMAHDLIQDVFIRLLHALPAFELSNSRGRFRSYLWKLTYSALVDRARQVKVRQHAEEEWVKRFKIGDESEGRKLETELDEINHQRFLEMALSRVRTVASATAWTCFEERMLRDRPAAAIAGELGISVNAVFVCASRVLTMSPGIVSGGAIDLNPGTYAFPTPPPSVATITNSVFTGNVAIGTGVEGSQAEGGSVNAGSYGDPGGGTITISGSTFTANQALGDSSTINSSDEIGGPAQGGAINSYLDALALTSDTFSANAAVGGSGETVQNALGGAVNNQLYSYYTPFPTLTTTIVDSLFTPNQAIGGTGVP